MRPTYLEFRSPKEKTPDAYNVKVTCVGKSLGFTQTSLRGTFSQSQRFQQYEIDARRTPCTVGPGCYKNCSLDLTKPRKGVPAYKGFQMGKDVGNNGYFYSGNHLVFDPAFVLKSRRTSIDCYESCGDLRKGEKGKKEKGSKSGSQWSDGRKRPASAKPRF